MLNLLNPRTNVALCVNGIVNAVIVYMFDTNQKPVIVCKSIVALKLVCVCISLYYNVKSYINFLIQLLESYITSLFIQGSI